MNLNCFSEKENTGVSWNPGTRMQPRTNTRMEKMENGLIDLSWVIITSFGEEWYLMGKG